MPGNPAQGEPAVAAASVLGQIEVDGDDIALLVSYDGSFWSIDIDTGLWVEIFVGTIAEDQQFGSEVALSESGTRVYAVENGRLLVISLDPSNLAASGWTWNEIPSSGGGFQVEEILFANDDALFVLSGDDVVRLAAPIR